MSDPVTRTTDLIEWLTANGGYFHPSAELRKDDTTGMSVFSNAPLGADEKYVSCPFDLAVTCELATKAICAVAKVQEKDLVWPAGTVKEGEEWSERMRICAYLGLHWVYEDKPNEEWPAALAHQKYLASLPLPEELTTPLYYDENELNLLQGTNLLGAVQDRKKEWSAESQALRTVLKEEGLTWDRYLATATYMSSRAFPSKLLELPKEGEASKQAFSEDRVSKPILLPGVDIFNHARGQPIVWLSALTASPNSSSPIPSISLVSTKESPADTQLFNNYGAKPNDELLLGYGFVLDPNPDDVVNLRLGSASLPPAVIEKLKPKGLNAAERFEVKRDGVIPKTLLEVMRIMLSGGEDEHDHDCEEEHGEDEHAMYEQEAKEMELELDVLGMLGGMLDDKLEKLERSEAEVGKVRADVVKACAVYKQGQKDILNTAMDKISERIERIEGLMDEGMGGCPCCS
ncbi:hypothetical protein IAR50_000566 [Cryptococcus sp. DSM 104548]